MNKVIAIAGGSGAGKSTICTKLQDEFPNKICLVQLDDYFKPNKDVPTLKGHENWDHPEALYLDKLHKDLIDLRDGKSVDINTKNERLNPDYAKTEKRIPVTFHPKPIILVEGFLALYDPKLRSLYDCSIWLDADHSTRWSRRVHFKYDEYEKDVIIPMYKKFAEPSKSHANEVIDVEKLSEDEVYEKVSSIIAEYLK